ncbi:unnamed protein product [Blepharisma stoltei]|uniref:Uncharacterized protein n=1 Tax=Blepharisma stoltei TaxID=1481888 RepID=A0AAU9ID99_9CILI|nr:unnamed protein product [Blepharisma stoltei]
MQELLKQALINYKPASVVRKPLEVKSKTITLKERIISKNRSEKIISLNYNQPRNLSRCKNSDILNKRKKLDYKGVERSETLKNYTDFFSSSFIKQKKGRERKSKSWGELPKMQPIKKCCDTKLMINIKNLIKSRMACKTAYHKTGDINLSPWQ